MVPGSDFGFEILQAQFLDLPFWWGIFQLISMASLGVINGSARFGERTDKRVRIITQVHRWIGWLNEGRVCLFSFAIFCIPLNELVGVELGLKTRVYQS